MTCIIVFNTPIKLSTGLSLFFPFFQVGGICLKKTLKYGIFPWHSQANAEPKVCMCMVQLCSLGFKITCNFRCKINLVFCYADLTFCFSK